MRTKAPYAALGTSLLMSLGVLVALSVLPRGEPDQENKPPNLFEKRDSGRAFDLSYGWRDFNKKSLQVSFPISKKALSDAEEEFGYAQEELDRHLESWASGRNREMIASLKDFLQQLIDESGFERYILIEERDDTSFNLKLSVPYNLQDQVKPVYEAIKTRLAEEYEAGTQSVREGISGERKKFIESRGFVMEGKVIRVDYRKSVRNNRPRVRHVLEALQSIDEKLNLRRFLGLSLSFIQDIGYGIPPTVEGDRLILGYHVPPRVLADNLGDCDSKGAAFASLWTNFKKYPVILIRIPEHMFVGLAVPALVSEGVVINGLRYTLCEVSANEKIPPGMISYYSTTYLRSGRYRYEFVSE